MNFNKKVCSGVLISIQIFHLYLTYLYKSLKHKKVTVPAKDYHRQSKSMQLTAVENARFPGVDGMFLKLAEREPSPSPGQYGSVS